MMRNKFFRESSKFKLQQISYVEHHPLTGGWITFSSCSCKIHLCKCLGTHSSNVIMVTADSKGLEGPFY